MQIVLLLLPQLKDLCFPILPEHENECYSGRRSMCVTVTEMCVTLVGDHDSSYNSHSENLLRFFPQFSPNWTNWGICSKLLFPLFSTDFRTEQGISAEEIIFYFDIFSESSIHFKRKMFSLLVQYICNNFHHIILFHFDKIKFYKILQSEKN